jgi:AraC-like DNA-binding protein
LSLNPVDSRPIYEAAESGIATCNGGGEFFLVGGRFAFSDDYASVLFGALPPIIKVKEASDQASVLRWSLDLLASEVRSRQPGGILVAEHLAHIMLVQVLRLYLASPTSVGVGWFFALSHPQIGAAMNAMHSDPARSWTLEQLCHLTGMSRSSFAQKFRKLVGTSPIEYLTRWRMLVASNRLLTLNENVAAIAYSLGYESESAFSTAFKRTMLVHPEIISAERLRQNLVRSWRGWLRDLQSRLLIWRDRSFRSRSRPAFNCGSCYTTLIRKAAEIALISADGALRD